MKIAILFLLVFSLTAHMLGQAVDVSSLSKDDAGRRVLAYFDAFNSDDPAKLKTFFTENIAPDALKQRPVEPRLAFHRKVKEDFGRIDLMSVVSIMPDEIKVIGKSQNGSLISYGFIISPNDHKLANFAIEPRGDAPPPPSVAAAPKSMAELPNSVKDLFDGLARAGQFSGVALIAKDGTPIFSNAWGMADASKDVANRVDTRFNLGSINKLFTRIAIGQLVKAGKLSFNDHLSKVLPDYPNKSIAEKVTIGQLVSMTSGMGDFVGEKYWTSDHSRIRKLSDYVPLFVDHPFEFEPGTKNRYSNAGYVVLGLVIEKLSRMSYYDYIRENVFVPAGMTDSDSFEIDKLPPNTARGYMTKGAATGRVQNTTEQPARGSSAGGGYSTAGDLLKLAAALKAGKLAIPADDGTFPKEFVGTGIAGGSEGVNALFLTNAATGFTVIVLSNFDPPSAEQPGMMVRDWLKQIAP